jgi:hypothetical protein
MGEDGPGRNARGPRKENEDLFRKLVVWLERSEILKELVGKVHYQVLLKIGTDNPLSEALNKDTK